MTYKIVFLDEKKQVKEIQDFSFPRKDRCKMHYWEWCKHRGYTLIDVINIREYKKSKENSSKQAQD